MKRFLSNLLAILWFFGVIIWVLLFVALVDIMIIFMDILGPIQSGFSTTTIGFIVLFVAGFAFALTGWIPPFRKCYYKLPWLYPTSMILTMHLFILSVAETIINKGYTVMSTPRHVISIIIMIIQLVVCRVIMCWYLKKHPMVLKKYTRIEE